MAELRDDLRFAARLFRKSPGFTTVAVVSLALAIGANTAIFSVVNGVLLRPLPFREPEQLFQVVRDDGTRADAPLSAPQYAFLLRQERPFSGMTAWPVVEGGFNLSGEGSPERVRGVRVTQSFFEVLGVPLVLGRNFLPEEDVEGGPRAVVLSHELWQRRFGGSADAVGRSLTLDGERHTIVGVAPPGFDEPDGAELWAPLRLDLASREDAHYLTVVGRLKPGENPAEVGAWVREQGEALRATRPGVVRPGHWLTAGELQSLRVRAVRPALLVLLGAVGLVLLIACMNLANLHLARATRRERELAVRIALGAGPARVVRQLLTESVLQAMLGGALGLLLAAWGLPALLALAPEEIPLPGRIQIDGAVLAFTLGVSMLAGLLFGVLPAWQASRMEPGGSLQVRARRTPVASGKTTRWLLVVSEVALAVILLVGASLLVKSFFLLRGREAGFDAREVWTMKLSLPVTRYPDTQALEVFSRRVMERVRGLPGVQAVGFALTVPMDSGIRLDLSVEGRRPGEGAVAAAALVHYRPVTRGYFDALKLDVVRGRLLDELDRHGSPPVALVNEAAARLFWPGRDPLGQRVTVGRVIPQFTDPEPREIIGVVRDVRELGLHEEPPPVVYLPLGQIPEPFYARFISLNPQTLMVRAPGDPEQLAAAVRREVHAVDPAQPVTQGVSMEEVVSRGLGAPRFNALLLGLMAGLALALAAVGIHGVLSYRVTQRTQEIGVRMALGATRGAVVWLVIRGALSAVLVGVALGLAGAFGLTRLLSPFLYGVSALDPVMFLTAPVVLVGVALASTWLPAWRASRVDPMVALRSE